MGLRPTKGGENAPFQQLLSPEAPPSPLSSRPEKSWAFGPPKVMKNVCPATTVAGRAALPFVISTGAPKERSGEICGVSGPFLGMFFDRAPKACGPRKVAIRHLNVVPAGDLLVAA